MSASLVGSEMCIRDRSKPITALALGPSPEQVHNSVRTQVHLKHGGSGTVSYTHLTLPTICSV
eukprot:8028495-Alexandrium_andersonii.AAC.1